jgi:hypothetical protein
MPEDQSAKSYMFTLYPDHNEAIERFARIKCRGNRSEAIRRMIEFAVENMPSQATTEQYVVTHPNAEIRSAS